jgi:hypothetical protein
MEFFNSYEICNNYSAGGPVCREALMSSIPPNILAFSEQRSAQPHLDNIYCTVKVIIVLCVTEPETPVTVIV